VDGDAAGAKPMPRAAALGQAAPGGERVSGQFGGQAHRTACRPAGRPGREKDAHPGGRTALVGEGVNPALRDVEEVALDRVDPGLPVEEPDGALTT